MTVNFLQSISDETLTLMARKAWRARRERVRSGQDYEAEDDWFITLDVEATNRGLPPNSGAEV